MMKRTMLTTIVTIIALSTISSLQAAELSIYDIQYTDDPNGESPQNGLIIDCSGGIVTHKSPSGRPRLIIQDPAYPDGWGAIQVKDLFGTGVFDDVNVGDWISLTNVLVEEFKGSTFLQFMEENNAGFEVLSSYNPLPEPLVITANEIEAPVEDLDTWAVSDHGAEKYESMLVSVIGVSVTDLGYGKAYDNYVLVSDADPNKGCWVSDYMNADKEKGLIYHPYVDVGQHFYSVTGILEQYMGDSDGIYYDYYQLLTRSSDDFQTGLLIYEIQYTEDANGVSPQNGNLVDCLGGIVTHKQSGGRPRLVLQDPIYPDGWGAIQVKGWSSDAFDGVAVGDCISLTNVLVEDFKGTTFLQYQSEYDSALKIVDVNNPLPRPLIVGIDKISVPIEGFDSWVVSDHVAEKYESMLVSVIGVSVTDLGHGKAYDNYMLVSDVDPNKGCWVSDYMNADKEKGLIYHPYVEVGQHFYSVTGILEQYMGDSDGIYYDYYQLLTRSSDDFQTDQPTELSIYEIQYTEDANGASPRNGNIVDCLGGVVTHKQGGGRPRLVLQDPIYPDGWGAIQVKGWSSDAFDGVAVGDWVSLTNVLVEDFKGTTFLQYQSEYDSALTVVDVNNPLPRPFIVEIDKISAPVESLDSWVVSDHAAEKYESMLVSVIGVSVTDLGYGKAYDNYVLVSDADPNSSCWVSDYMNADKEKGLIYHPYVEVGQHFYSVTGILEQYMGDSDGIYYDYYQFLTRSSDDFGLDQVAEVGILTGSRHNGK
jgi:mRNA-degrading endonuclease toxin of MazEF toxin-antitoxin module